LSKKRFYRIQVWQTLTEQLDIVVAETTFFTVIVHRIAAGLFEEEQCYAARQQFAYLVFAAFAEVFKSVKLLEDVGKIMADGFVNLPYNDLTALAVGGLGA
jgi:hypothetical protein